MRSYRFAVIVILMALASAAWGAAIPPVWDSSFGSAVIAGDDNSGGPYSLGVTFPFLGANYTGVYISTNGFLSLGGDNGAWCCSGDITSFLNDFPRISPAWLDWVDTVYLNTFADHATITWDGGEYGTGAGGQFQVQLYTNGLIIFGYNALAYYGHTGLVGVSPGGGAADPGGTDLVTGLPTIAGPTVYQTAVGLTSLEGHSLGFAPLADATTGWLVFDAPEPSTFGLLAIGAGAFLAMRRRKRSA